VTRLRIGLVEFLRRSKNSPIHHDLFLRTYQKYRTPLVIRSKPGFHLHSITFLRRLDVGEPPVEPGRAETGAGARNQRLLAHFDAEIGRRRISQYLTRVLVIFEDLADRFVHSERVEPGDLDRAVYRFGESRQKMISPSNNNAASAQKQQNYDRTDV
jgi:hypothetical protein